VTRLRSSPVAGSSSLRGKGMTRWPWRSTRRTGILWRQSYPAPYEPVQSAARHGKGAKSTPLYYDGKLYTFGISGILSCFDAATGKVEWRKEYSKDFKATWPQFGTSMSPVASGGMIMAEI